MDDVQQGFIQGILLGVKSLAVLHEARKCRGSGGTPPRKFFEFSSPPPKVQFSTPKNFEIDKVNNEIQIRC